MRVLLQLRVNSPSGRKIPKLLKKKKRQRKRNKRTPEAEAKFQEEQRDVIARLKADKNSPEHAAKVARQTWTDHWVDIGFAVVPDDGLVDVDWLQDIPGLKMGDHVRIVQVQFAEKEQPVVAEADMLPAFLVRLVPAADHLVLTAVGALGTLGMLEDEEDQHESPSDDEGRVDE